MCNYLFLYTQVVVVYFRLMFQIFCPYCYHIVSLVYFGSVIFGFKNQTAPSVNTISLFTNTRSYHEQPSKDGIQDSRPVTLIVHEILELEPEVGLAIQK